MCDLKHCQIATKLKSIHPGAKKTKNTTTQSTMCTA